MTSTTTTMAASTNGHASTPSRSSGRKEPFPHVDDLTSVSVELDPHTPLRKVLETGDSHMRQAITYSDFRRPDLALQEYIRAFTIAVDKIPKHKDYPSLKSDRTDLGRLYSALKIKISNHAEKFDKIKADIKEDNRLSGVKSKKEAAEDLLSSLPSVPTTVPNHASNHSPSHSRIHSLNGVNGINGIHGAHQPPNGAAHGTVESRRRSESAASVHKQKPPPPSKPQALHGNAVKVASPAQDLASRFAKLRESQDGSPRPATPVQAKGSPAVARPQPRVNCAVPIMPKMPDAIYSPARGTITSEVADLPSSTPRGMFSRTNSMASVSGSGRNSIDVGVRTTSSDQFASLHNLGSRSSTPVPSSPRMQIPPGPTLTPLQLQEYMQKGASVVRLLLIDVRGREDFDDGHIMSQNTICIEPSVLTRGSLSADDIEESMGIAPDEEMKAFEDRAKFDLVVLYDEESTTISGNPRDEQGTALLMLYQALDQFNYARELRNKPKLLQGGVEAWTDLFGRHSLQESKTSAAVRDGRNLHQRRNRDFAARPNIRQRARAQTKALRPEEINEFEKKIKEDEAAARSPQDFVRSTEDFLRRYPAASEIQESMTSVTSKTPPVSQTNGFDHDLPPAPPTRPAPAVPRTSYSGLSTKDPTNEVVAPKTALTGIPERDRPTGLVNPHNNCFANAAIQALLYSPGFAPQFAAKEWPTNWKPAAQNPQLMARILGNLIQWLAGRQFDTMQPTTFMRYCQSIHSGYRLPGSNRLCKFGDGTQHDSSEFLFDFVFEQLDNETNRSPDTKFLNYSQPGEDLKKQDRKKAQAMPIINLALFSWKLYTSFRNTLTTEYWGVLQVDRNICRTCQDSVDSFGYSHYLDLGIAGSSRDPPIHLKQLLDEQYNTRETRHADGDKGYECGTEIGEVHRSKDAFTKLVRLPPLLAIRFKRWDSSGAKVLRKVAFDIHNLNLTEYTIDTSGNPAAANVNGFGPERLYDLYAVIAHRGDASISGHYVAYVRDGAAPKTEGDTWFFCNDGNVSKRRIGPNATRPLEREWFDCADNFTPFVIFYKRKDVPWTYAKPPSSM